MWGAPEMLNRGNLIAERPESGKFDGLNFMTHPKEIIRLTSPGGISCICLIKGGSRAIRNWGALVQYNWMYRNAEESQLGRLNCRENREWDISRDVIEEGKSVEIE